MKIKFEKKYIYWGLTAFLVIIASIGCFLALFKFEMISNIFDKLFVILKPVLFGLVIAYLLNPVLLFSEKCMKKIFMRKPKNKAKAKKLVHISSVLMTVLFVILLLIILVSIILPQILGSIIGIVENFSVYYKNLTVWFDDLLVNNPDFAKQVDNTVDNLYEFVMGWVSRDLMPQVNNLVTNLTSGMFNVVMGFKDFMIGFIISVYLLFNKSLFLAQAKKVIYAVFKITSANWILETSRFAHQVFSKFMTGILLDSTVVGIITFTFLNIADMPFPLLISVIAGISNIIPVFGPYIGGLPSVILIMLIDPIQAIYYLIFVVILQMVDGNLIAPRILGDATGLSGFWVIFSILTFGGIFGFVGMLVGVPTFAVIYSLIKVRVNKTLDNKNLPNQTNMYTELKYINNQNKIVKMPKED